MQAIPGYTSEAKWLRHARAHLRHLFPYLPQQPGYNKRLRKAAGLMRSVNRILATTSVWSDDVWVVDSTAPGGLPGPPKIAHTFLHGLWLGDDLPDQPHRILALLERPAFAAADTDAIVLFRKAAALRRFDEALAAITQAMEALPVNAGSGAHGDLVRERALILTAREA